MNYFIKYTLLLFIAFVSFSTANGQDEADEGILFEDHVYLNNIRSITWHRSDSVFAYPIIQLNSFATMVLGFDDLDAEIKTFTYSVQHCDKDWNPTDIMELEYIEGFENERINEANFSLGTLTPYAHYELNIPNEEYKLKLSGNYLLKVYDDEDDRKLALTRRFMVVEPKMGIKPKFVSPFDVTKSRTHHEIDFEVTHKKIKIQNPLSSVSVTVLQNGRWDNAIKNLAPRIHKTERLIYDFSDAIIFESGNEFRQLDMRTYRLLTEDMSNLEEYDDGYFVEVKQDEKRRFKNFHTRIDVNGQFVIENLDDSQFRSDRLINGFYNYAHSDHNMRGDYAIVRFRLKATQDFENEDVYIIGKMTDWKLNEEFKMKYDSDNFEYVADCILKQGYYNYIYTVAPKGKKTHTHLETEGNFYEADNDYTILVYYRPFGSQYDHLVAARTINSYDSR